MRGKKILNALCIVKCRGLGTCHLFNVKEDAGMVMEKFARTYLINFSILKKKYVTKLKIFLFK